MKWLLIDCNLVLKYTVAENPSTYLGPSSKYCNVFFQLCSFFFIGNFQYCMLSHIYFSLWIIELGAISVLVWSCVLKETKVILRVFRPTSYCYPHNKWIKLKHLHCLEFCFKLFLIIIWFMQVLEILINAKVTRIEFVCLYHITYDYFFFWLLETIITWQITTYKLVKMLMQKEVKCFLNYFVVLYKVFKLICKFTYFLC